MSLSIGELIGYLRIDDTGVDDGLTRSEQRIEGFKGAAGALGAAAGGAIGAGLSVAMGNAVDFQAGQAKLAAQLNLTSAESAAAGDLAGSLYSQNWGASLDDINTAIKGVAQNMGVEINSVDMEPLARQATILADVFEIDLASSTRAAGNLMQHLGMDGQAAMDTIARVTQNGGARAADLVDTLEEYPVQFSKLGLSGEQAMGIINQGMLAGARNTDIMGDALKEFSIRAIDGSKTSAEGYALMGLNAEQMTAQIARGGPEAAAGLQTVTDALRAMEDPVQRDAAAVALFGTQAEDLGPVLDAINPATAVTSLGDFAGAVDTAGNAAGDTAAGKLETLRRQFEMFGTGLIETEGPLGMIAAGVSEFGPAAIGMAGSLAMIGMAIGPLLVQLGAMVVRLATTVASYTVLFAQLAWIVISGVARMVGALLLWVAQQVIQGAIAVASMIATAASYVASWIAMAAVAVVQAAIMAASWIAAMGPVGWVIALVVGLVALIIANWDTVVAWTTSAWTAVSGFLSDTWNNITGFVSGAVAAVVGWITDAWNNVTSTTSSAWDAVLGFITGAWNAITSFVSGAITGVVNFISDAWNNAVRLASDAWNNIVNAVRSGASSVLSFVAGLPGQILGALGNLGSLLFNAGRSVVQGLWNGIVGMGSWLFSQIMGWIRRVVPGPILQFLGIASPSKFMRDQVGRWIPEGLADGIIGNAKVAGDAARSLAADVAAQAQKGAASTAMQAVELGTITDQQWDQLRGMGYKGRAGDSREALYVPQNVLDQITGAGQRSVTVNVHNPLPETTSDSINRRARSLAILGSD